MYENVGPSNGNSVSTHICCIEGNIWRKNSITKTLTSKGLKYICFHKCCECDDKTIQGGSLLECKINKFLRPSHSYISMLPLSTTWVGGHSKTNIPDIMYISDFYSSSFLHTDHETIEWTKVSRNVGSFRCKFVCSSFLTSRLLGSTMRY